jgi:hypothetical protein
VNSSVGTFSALTVNGKGLVTAATNLSLTGDITGTASGASLATTLATVNSNTGTYAGLTVNGKGLVTAASQTYTTVRVATTTAGTLSTSFANGQTVDGVTLATGDKILIKDQATASENGLYTVNASGSPTRATEFSASSTATTGMKVYVTSGTTNAISGWVLTTTGTITVGTTGLTFQKYFGNGVTTGTFTATTIDAFGRVTSGSNLTASGDATGTASGSSIALTLASVNSNVGTFSAVTVNGKGLVTAATNLSATGDATGTASGSSIALTLATVNSNVGTFNGLTVNAKGLVTAAAAISGDVSVSGSTATLATVNSNVGTFTAVTVNGKGLTTAATNLTATGDATGTASGSSIALTLAASGVSAGTYTSVTVNSKGLVTAGGNATLQTMYNNSSVPQITLNSTQSTLTIRDASTTIGGNLVAVQNNAGTTNYFAVTTQGVQIPAGSISSPSLFISGNTSTGLFQSSSGNLDVSASGVEVARFATATSGVNFVQFTAAATNAAPTIASSGSDTNIDLMFNAKGSGSFGFGTGLSDPNYQALCHGNGNFATAGDAQTNEYVARALTTTNTATEMFLDGAGASQRMVLPNNSAWMFNAEIIMRRTDATGTSGAWILNGLMTRDATASTTALNGTISTTVVAKSAGVTNPTITADTTNGSLKISVTGNTSQTMRWVAVVKVVQVTN